MTEEKDVEVAQEQPKMTDEERAAKLIEWGYFIREYSPDNSRSEEYPFADYNGEVTTYYKKVPNDMTDEEFEEIAAEVAEREREKQERIRNRNTVATIFRVLGCVVFLAAFILGFVLGREPGRYSSHFYFPLALAYWGGGFISGMFMLAIGEVISLLERIKNKLDK